jgi:hypothetical protein
MKMKTALSTTFGMLMLSAAVMASAAGMAAGDMPVVKPLRGTVDSVDNNTLNFTTRSGAHQSIGLSDKTGIRLVSKTDVESIKSDSFIGQADGTLKALEVTVFEPSLKGSGEGHYGWENADGSTGTMTNGTVGKLSKANGRTLSVGYKGGEKQLVVPEDVPIAYVQPGKVDELVKGAKIVVFPGEDGKTARGVAVGKDGFQPPM